MVPLDAAAIAALRELPFVEVNDAAHAREHSLEVHLPFLQAVLGSFSLVPLVVGDADPGEMATLFETVWGGRETLIVVSSDLSHYLPYESARSRDRDTARAIVGLEATLVPEEACGAAPINGLLRAARRHGMAAGWWTCAPAIPPATAAAWWAMGHSHSRSGSMVELLTRAATLIATRAKRSLREARPP
jgi:AmmeMemoRadiSam system protein B